MRSTWLGLGLGLLTLIGCNAIWQGYLSPLDDPAAVVDLSDVDLTGADLTGVPPADLTGADLTGVPPPDMTTPPKPCGFAPGASGVFKYNNYSQLFTISGQTPSRIAVMDIDNDGLAEVATSDLTKTVRIWKPQINSASCMYSPANNCDASAQIYDIGGFMVDPSNGPGAFIVARNLNTTAAVGSCAGNPPVFKAYIDPKFSNTSVRKELNLPPLKSATTGIFTVFEKGTDAVGDRVNSVKLNATLDLVSVVTVVSLGNISPFEPRNAASPRLNTNAYDGILDVAALEVGTVNGGRLRVYNNNHAASPPANPFSTGVAAANQSDTFADINRLTTGKLTADANDDVIAIVNSPIQVVPFTIDGAGVITQKPPTTLTIPAASANRNAILFADVSGDGIDELITINAGNVAIYTYNGNTFAGPQNLSIPNGYNAVAIALGYLEKSFSSSAPDIFVITTKAAAYEVGVFRYLP